MANHALYQRLRLIHYTTGLPVQWVENGAVVFSLPQAVKWVGSIVSVEGPLPAVSLPREQTRAAFLHLENPYGEHYVSLGGGNGKAVLAGPYGMESYAETDGLQMIRRQQLPLKYHKAILAHLAALPRLSEPGRFYVGKLLELVFQSEPLAEETEGAAGAQADMDAPYYQNAYANRMALFHHPPLFFEQELSRQIAVGNPVNAKRVLLELNTLSRARLADSPIRSLKNSLICSVTLFTRAAIEGGVPVDEAFTLSDTCIQAIEQMSGPKELADFEAEVVMGFVDRVARYQSQRYSPSIQRAVQFIDDHLTEPLVLAGIAAHAYVHPDYLSARFHKETGSTLTEFIQKRRVEESAHFLRYSESSVSEIAAFYQFCSQSYYIQVFKKHMGTTPAMYRAGKRGREPGF